MLSFLLYHLIGKETSRLTVNQLEDLPLVQWGRPTGIQVAVFMLYVYVRESQVTQKEICLLKGKGPNRVFSICL